MSTPMDPGITSTFRNYMAWNCSEISSFLRNQTGGIHEPIDPEKNPAPISTHKLEEWMLEELMGSVPRGAAKVPQFQKAIREFIEDRKEAYLAEGQLLHYYDFYIWAQKVMAKRRHHPILPGPGKEDLSCCPHGSADTTHYWSWRHLIRMADEDSERLRDLAQ